MTTPDSLRFCVLSARGFVAQGHHDPATLPVPSALAAAFNARHPALLAKVLARPGGFDGERACLTGWEQRGDELFLTTGHRSYTEGLALREVLAQARAAGQFDVGDGDQPLPSASWGASLVCFVLLPQRKVLAGRRSLTMMANPGVWSCGFTEILEPADVRPEGMHALPQRLITEELPLLAQLGTPRLLGLGVRQASYTWQLVGLLDLLSGGDEVLALVDRLPTDAETDSWAALPLDTDSAVHDLALARQLVDFLQSAT